MGYIVVVHVGAAAAAAWYKYLILIFKFELLLLDVWYVVIAYGKACSPRRMGRIYPSPHVIHRWPLCAAAKY